MESNVFERYHSIVDSFSSQIEESAKLELSPDEIRFQSLLISMEEYYISMRDAIKIVGGRKRLERLMDSDRVKGKKPEGAQNRKWLINAADCYRNIRPRLNILLKKQKNQKLQTEFYKETV